MDLDTTGGRRHPREQTGRRTGDALRRAGWAALAATAILGLAAFVVVHPLGWWLPLGGVAICAVTMLLHRDAWLVVLFALWPIIDLAPRTGMIFWTESDALVLTVLAVIGVREALAKSKRVERDAARGWAFGFPQVSLVLIMAASYVVSTRWTPLAAIGSDPNLLVGYDSELNGIRLAKGFFLAAALIPPLAASFGRDGAGAARRLALGVIAGLVSASLAALWERLAFTGLSDFSTDYRTTAQFWEMNVGGAQLDGWLALAFPFALWRALRERSPARLAVWLLLVAVALYAIFTTFARGLYMAVVLATAVLLLALWQQGRMSNATRRTNGQTIPVWKFAARVVWAATFAWAIAEVFRTGGYRGMAAALGLAAGAYLTGPVVRQFTFRGVLIAVFGATATGVGGFLLFSQIGKGPYVAYACSAMLVFALGLSTFRRAPPSASPGSVPAVLVAFVLQAAASVWVAVHWGGGVALVPALVAVAIITIPAMAAPAVPALRWEPSLRGLLLLGLGGGAVALLAVTFHTYYAASRFETTGEDFRGRLQHWSRGASLVGPDQVGFGIGTGRYAPAYFWNSDGKDLPGNHRIGVESGDAYLTLGGPRHVLGFGELYRVMQRVADDPVLPVTVTLRARSPDLQGVLHVEVCRRHLIYVQGCATRQVPVAAGVGWKPLTISLDVGDFRPNPGSPPRPVYFAVANYANGRSLDVDDLSVVDTRGRSLVANGGFTEGTARWFFSSDKHHLPWHAKNLWLHYWIEQGALGVLAFSLITAAALFRLGVGTAARNPLAPPLLAGLAGFLAVGLFDSLVDAPRLALAFFMLAFVALGMRSPHAAGSSQAL